MEAQPLDDNIIKEKEKITGMLVNTNTALDAADYLNDQKYLDNEEARMYGDPHATMHGQEAQMSVVQTAEGVEALRKEIQKALNNQN